MDWNNLPKLHTSFLTFNQSHQKQDLIESAAFTLNVFKLGTDPCYGPLYQFSSVT